MKIKWFLRVILLFVLCFVFSPPAFAQTPPIVGANLNAYVPPTGAECNINVPSQYSTIQAGLDAAAAGDTVCVGPGTYNESVYINKRSIRLSGSGAYQSVIMVSPINGVAQGTVVVAGDGNGNNAILEGFLIRGTDVDPDTINANSLNLGPGLSGAIIRYNWIVGGFGKYIVRADGSQNTDLIQNNIFEANNTPLILEINPEAYRFDVINNTFIGTLGGGEVMGGFYNNSLIKRNVFNVSGTIDTLIGSVRASNIVTENNFNSNTGLKVSAYPGFPLYAEYNWWGDTDPSDNVLNEVDYSNFALSPFPEYPVPVLPIQAINNIIDLVQTYNLQRGISNSLDVKLSAALDSLNDLNQHNDSAALNSLQAFINAVNAQRGNKITSAQADTLIQRAQEIINNI